MNHEENLVKICSLIEQLYAKYPAYVVFTFTLGTNKNGNIDEPYVEYNIYTPEISHNKFRDNYIGFIQFLEKLLVDGVKDVRVSVLEKQLEIEQLNKGKAENNIVNLERELKGIER